MILNRWKSLYSSGALCCLCLAFSAAMAQGLSAQDPNPFGDSPMSDDPFGTNVPTLSTDPTGAFGGFAPAADATSSAVAPAGTSATESGPDPSPVVRLLRETPPQTPNEMAQGLSWVVRLKRWDEVRRLLDLVAAKNWSLAELSELAKSGEPSLWLRLSIDEAGLSEQQRKLVNDVLAAPRKLASDPAWLDSWIDQLSAPQPGLRRVAQLRLQDGGNAAIERLLERLLSGDTKVDAGMLAGTVAEFGESGADALRAACLVADAERSGRVFLGIAEIPGNEFSAELGAGLSSSVLSPQTRSALAEILLRRFSRLPTPEAVHDYLTERFRIKLESYQQTRTNDVAIADVLWRPTKDGRSVTAIAANGQDRQLESVAQLAAHRLNLTLSTTEELVDCGAVLLQRAYQVQPSLEQSASGATLLAQFNHTVATETSYWIRVFDQATELQFHGGAVRAMQMVVASTPGRESVPLDFFTRLLGDTRPMVRYLALKRIAALDPQQSFAGAEKVLEVALEMSRLGNGPHALVVGMNSELRSAAEQQLELQAGARVTGAHSARSALQTLDGATPVEMVVIVDRTADQSIYELLQRIRGSERGRALPIAVLTDELYQHERRLIAETPSVIGSILTRAPDQMQRVIGQLTQRLDTQPFTTAERNELARVASEFLSRIGSNRDTYAFYPLSDLRSEMLDVGTGLPIDLRLGLLSGLGTRESQQQLIGFASRRSALPEERMQAAQALEHSVKRFGMNLGREDILQAYDSYNTLGPNDPATAKALGSVLDVIERHAAE